MRAFFVAPVLLAAVGCWQPRYFEPRENLTGLSPDGRAAAVYQVARGGAERVRGELRVWSDGAVARYAEDSEEVVDLHVAFELENNGEGPLELDLDGLRLEELVLDGAPSPELGPSSVAGSGRAEPGSTSRVDVVFRPPTTYPSDVEAFGVRFSVRDGFGGAVGQKTPFAPARAVPYGGLYWGGGSWAGGFWGPYGGWSAGWGPGWGGPWQGYWGGYPGWGSRCP